MKIIKNAKERNREKIYIKEGDPSSLSFSLSNSPSLSLSFSSFSHSPSLPRSLSLSLSPLLSSSLPFFSLPLDSSPLFSLTLSVSVSLSSPCSLSRDRNFVARRGGRKSLLLFPLSLFLLLSSSREGEIASPSLRTSLSCTFFSSAFFSSCDGNYFRHERISPLSHSVNPPRSLLFSPFLSYFSLIIYLSLARTPLSPSVFLSFFPSLSRDTFSPFSPFFLHFSLAQARACAREEFFRTTPLTTSPLPLSHLSHPLPLSVSRSSSSSLSRELSLSLFSFFIFVSSSLSLPSSQSLDLCLSSFSLARPFTAVVFSHRQKKKREKREERREKRRG